MVFWWITPRENTLTPEKCVDAGKTHYKNTFRDIVQITVKGYMYGNRIQ